MAIFRQSAGYVYFFETADLRSYSGYFLANCQLCFGHFCTWILEHVVLLCSCRNWRMRLRKLGSFWPIRTRRQQRLSERGGTLSNRTACLYLRRHTRPRSVKFSYLKFRSFLWHKALCIILPNSIICGDQEYFRLTKKYLTLISYACKLSPWQSEKLFAQIGSHSKTFNCENWMWESWNRTIIKGV